MHHINSSEVGFKEWPVPQCRHLKQSPVQQAVCNNLFDLTKLWLTGSGKLTICFIMWPHAGLSKTQQIFCLKTGRGHILFTSQNVTKTDSTSCLKTGWCHLLFTSKYFTQTDHRSRLKTGCCCTLITNKQSQNDCRSCLWTSWCYILLTSKNVTNWSQIFPKNYLSSCFAHEQKCHKLIAYLA